MFSPSLNGKGIMYAPMDVIHAQVEMGYDRFQFCKQFDMRIKLWTSVHPNHFSSRYSVC
jgi:hypothetical protein